MSKETKQAALAKEGLQVHAGVDAGAHEDSGRRRDFPRFRKHGRPRCPKHPSRAMTGHKETSPHPVGAGAYKAGTRIIYRCVVAGCPHVSLGAEQPYFGESVKELGAMGGI